MATASPHALVVGVHGDFDACQSFVKRTLQDYSKREDIRLTSANSMNLGRFLPQAAYALSAYTQLVERRVIALGDEVDICYPTGNFGNILGGICAQRMGVPLRRIVCASNDNNVLADFLNTGTYDITQRAFAKTISPSMDILKSSNFLSCAC